MAFFGMLFRTVCTTKFICDITSSKDKVKNECIIGENYLL